MLRTKLFQRIDEPQLFTDSEFESIRIMRLDRVQPIRCSLFFDEPVDSPGLAICLNKLRNSSNSSIQNMKRIRRTSPAKVKQSEGCWQLLD